MPLTMVQHDLSQAPTGSPPGVEVLWARHAAQEHELRRLVDRRRAPLTPHDEQFVALYLNCMWRRVR